MPPIKSGTPKTVKYERTHEENQERAYIAASRRNDRNLEARMESARRASAIHEKRTGRALRVTESEVINEEMYEEVNDLPTEYRRLNAHLQTQSADFDRRLLAYLSSQMATRQAVSDCWQNEQSQFTTRGVSLSMLQEPQPHVPMSHLANRSAANHRHTPYPHATQSMHPGQPLRSASTATLYEAGVDWQQLQSQYINPHTQERHMSPPSNSAIQSPWSWDDHSVLIDARIPNNLPRTDSSVGMTGSPQAFHRPALNHVNESAPYHQPWQTNSGNDTEPLSATLSLNSQQILFDSTHSSVSSPPHNFRDRRYSYNPNGRPRPTSNSSTPLHYAMPSGSGQAISSPPSLRPVMERDSGSANPHGGALSQICDDVSGMGPSSSSTNRALGKTSEVVASGKA